MSRTPLTKISFKKLSLSAGRKKSPGTGQTTSLGIFLQDQKGAGRLQGELTNEGYHATLQKTQGKTKISSGFIAALDMDPVAAKPTANTLSNVYHLQVSVTTGMQDRVRVQVGPVYKTKEEASKTVQKLKELGFDWQVMQNYSEKPGQGYQILISDVPEDKLDNLEDQLSKKGVQFNIIQSH